MASGRRSRAISSMPHVEESDNPSNWTVTVLKKKLADIGIVINAQLSHSVLKRIYLDNVNNGVGKEVNLNVLLIPNYTTPLHKKNRENDERLVKNLTLDEFIIAFGRYKRIMCKYLHICKSCKSNQD